MTVQRSIVYPSKMPTAIFLDSGGVINDNALRTPQWVRYLGEFLPTTPLGGTAEVWGQANTAIVRPFFGRWKEYMAQAIELASKAQSKAIQEGRDKYLVESGQDRETNVYWIFEKLFLLIWMKEMCRAAGPSVPGLESEILPGLSDDELIQIAKSAHIYTIQRVKADFPGAVDTIRLLSNKNGSLTKSNHKLYTSSGDSLEDLEYIMKGLDVFECFDAIYGADNINYLKLSTKFYERIFERVNVRVVVRQEDVAHDVTEENRDREEVVVLDDSLKALGWARALGARTVFVSDEELDLSREEYKHIDYHIKALAEFPSLLESWRVHLEEKS